LFISHDDYRAGAPLVLLTFLRWLRASTDIEARVLLRDCYNDLRADFEDVAPVSVWNEGSSSSTKVPGWKAALASWVGGRGVQSTIGPAASERNAHQDALVERWREWQPDLIYSNTITNGAVLAALSHLGVPVITHVHELEFWIRHRLDGATLQQVTSNTNRYIAVSQAVRANLIANVGVSPESIDVVHGYVPRPLAQVADEQRAELRRALDIPPDAIVVGACGTLDWRKGADLFLQVACVVRAARPNVPVHFLWVGGDRYGLEYQQIQHDVAHADLASTVHFTGVVKDPSAHFRIFDVFALTSREDPFPLVKLEAAACGAPIVCFARAGGASEFVEDDCGFVVPYLDVDRFAQRVLMLASDDTLRRQLGEQAAAKVRQHHHIDAIAPRLLGVMCRVVSERVA
jgi:glycosyltransferase involved in cell wall biosynthesis